MTKYNFITFGAGTTDYTDAGKRLVRQAEQTQLFDSIRLYGLSDLKNDPVFWDKHSSFIQNNARGFGYWLWKPYLIKSTMDTMCDGDILLYLDCGCEINYRYANEVKHMFEIFSFILHFFI